MNTKSKSIVGAALLVFLIVLIGYTPLLILFKSIGLPLYEEVLRGICLGSLTVAIRTWLSSYGQKEDDNSKKQEDFREELKLLHETHQHNTVTAVQEIEGSLTGHMVKIGSKVESLDTRVGLLDDRVGSMEIVITADKEQQDRKVEFKKSLDRVWGYNKYEFERYKAPTFFDFAQYVNVMFIDFSSRVSRYELESVDIDTLKSEWLSTQEQICNFGRSKLGDAFVEKFEEYITKDSARFINSFREIFQGRRNNRFFKWQNSCEKTLTAIDDRMQDSWEDYTTPESRDPETQIA